MRKDTVVRGLAVAALVIAAGCTGSVNTKTGGGTGSSSSNGNTPGGATSSNNGGGASSTPGAAGAGTSANVGSDPAPSKVPIGTIAPTTTLDSGRVPIRQLNDAEYNNTVRDLLGTTLTPADKFPGDIATDGFDNIGSVAVVSDLLLEQAETAAGQLADELLARPKTDPLRAKILLCEPTTANLSTCMTQILTAFMKSAYRRPVTTAEVMDNVSLATTIATSAGDPMRGVNAAIKAVLLSPNFLYHVEIGNPASTAAAKISDYELASRLSYFLWSSMPDTTLMAAADAGKLTPAGADYTAQITRMLADPKSQAFIDNFAGQWLGGRDATMVAPDPTTFPTFDDALLKSIPQETGAFFAALIKNAAPLTDLVNANYGYVNDRLAKFYGIPGGMTTFTKVSLAGTQRLGGILTQETFLTVTSYPTRTSPVKRGNYVLERLLCDPTPTPPDNVPPLVQPTSTSGLTGRAALEAHRQSPVCMSCHATIDPLGLPFENFDAIGAYRTMENGSPIDATTMLKDGTMINGVSQLATLIAGDKRFTRCVTKQAMTYGVTRPFDAMDSLAYVAGIADPLMGKGTWPDLLTKVATSEAFLTRRGEAP